MAIVELADRNEGMNKSMGRNWIRLMRGLLWLGLGVVSTTWLTFASNPLAPCVSPSTLRIASTKSAVRPKWNSPLFTEQIASISLGDRVLGRNPLREEVDPAYAAPDPKSWRTVRLQLQKPNGKTLWIELLRPLTWIEALNAKPGATIYLELHELGAVGDAMVTHITPCPRIKPGKGTIVTGRFIYEASGDNVIELRLEGQSEATRVTANHRYWSIDRQQFVPAGTLYPGERVDTADASCRVASIRPISYDGLLYNLETAEHVYRVGSTGTLVHNMCSHAAFGLGRHIEDFTANISAKVGNSVERFPFPSLTRSTDNMWQGIRRTMNDVENIHFDLRGMTKADFQDWMLRNGHKFEPYPGSSRVTNRELYEVLTNESFLNKTTFYSEFGEIDAPLDWLDLPR